MLESLTQNAIYLVQQVLTRHATNIQGSTKDHNSPPLEASFISEYFTLVVDAYGHGSLTLTPLREALVKFIKFTRFFVMSHDTFRERLYELPEFSRDVLKATFQKSDIVGTFIIHDTPTECCSCNNRSEFFPETWMQYDEIRDFERYTLYGWCKECAGMYENADEFKDFLELD